jgi:hypothetical protein
MFYGCEIDSSWKVIYISSAAIVDICCPYGAPIATEGLVELREASLVEDLGREVRSGIESAKSMLNH